MQHYVVLDDRDPDGARQRRESLVGLTGRGARGKDESTDDYVEVSPVGLYIGKTQTRGAYGTLTI